MQGKKNPLARAIEDAEAQERIIDMQSKKDLETRATEFVAEHNALIIKYGVYIDEWLSQRSMIRDVFTDEIAFDIDVYLQKRYDTPLILIKESTE